jgi:hypothetical protein
VSRGGRKSVHEIAVDRVENGDKVTSQQQNSETLADPSKLGWRDNYTPLSLFPPLPLLAHAAHWHRFQRCPPKRGTFRCNIRAVIYRLASVMGVFGNSQLAEILNEITSNKSNRQNCMVPVDIALLPNHLGRDECEGQTAPKDEDGEQTGKVPSWARSGPRQAHIKRCLSCCF